MRPRSARYMAWSGVAHTFAAGWLAAIIWGLLAPPPEGPGTLGLVGFPLLVGAAIFYSIFFPPLLLVSVPVFAALLLPWRIWYRWMRRQTQADLRRARVRWYVACAVATMPVAVLATFMAEFSIWPGALIYGLVYGWQWAIRAGRSISTETFPGSLEARAKARAKLAARYPHLRDLDLRYSGRAGDAW